jgi:hypothetical protein
MTDANTLVQYVARKPPNTVLNAQILRNGKNRQVKIMLMERPVQEEVAAPAIMGDEGINGQSNYHGETQDAPMMSQEERTRLREELLQLFEKDAATQ